MTDEPQRCPTCGHIVEDRVISLTKSLVQGLFRVWMWCEREQKWEFDRKEIKHLLTTDSMAARFGDLIYFGGILYRPEDDKRRGSWAINRERAREFFANRLAVPSKVVIDRVRNVIVSRDIPIVMKEVPRLRDFLDSEFKYVPEYREGEQSRLLSAL